MFSCHDKSCFQYTETLATPFTLRSSGISSPGVFFSTIKLSFGSGDSSRSSTIACLMLKPLFAIIIAELARMPGVFGVHGHYFDHTQVQVLSDLLQRVPADRKSSNIKRSSRFSFMACSVSFTVLLSTPATRATRSRSGYSSRYSLTLRHIFCAGKYLKS